MPTLPGYQVLGRLGEGGMGVVYKARHLRLDRIVALKVIHPGRLGHPGLVERFYQEARAAARLAHPNVVSVYDVCEGNGVHLLALEYVEGTDLARVLRERARLPVHEACAYAHQAALGLQHAHEKGLVHRDVKPHNLMLTPQGQVKVLDFGLAKLTSEDLAAGALTEPGAVMGTPDYLAPEQACDARAADIRADVYSLGCTLYQLLSGQVPFPEGTALEKLAAHLQRTPRRLSELRPDVPPGLAQVVERMMAKDPARRYQTPAEVAEALAPFLRPQQSFPRRRAAVLAVGLVMLAAALLVPWALKRPTGAGDPAGEGKEGADPSTPVAVRIRPEGMGIAPGAPLSLAALVSRPAPLTGVRSWTIETREGRGTPLAVAYSPDGGRLAIASVDGVVRVWQAEGGQLITALVGQEGRGFAVAWSPDGKSLATGGEDRTVRLWDAASGRPLRTWRGHSRPVTRVGWSADGRTVASAGADHTVRLWDVESGKPLRVLAGHQGPVQALSWAPAGGRLASSGDDDTIRLWDRGSRECLTTIATEEKGVAQSLAWSPDGRLLAAGHRDKAVRLWSVAAGLVQRTWKGHQGAVLALEWSADGRLLASAAFADPGVRLWQPGSEQVVRVIQTGSPNVYPLALSPDGHSLVCGSKAGTVAVWNVHSGELRRGFGTNPAIVDRLAWSPSGKVLAAGYERGELRLWEATTGSMRRAWWAAGHRVTALAWSPDGKQLGSGCGENTFARFWDPATGRLVRTLQGHEGHVSAMAWSPNGPHLATGSGDRMVRLWDAGGTCVFAVDGHARAVTDLAWSPDGKRLASAGADHVVCLWGAAGERLGRLEGHTGPLSVVVWSPDGATLATGGVHQPVRLWHAAVGELAHSLPSEAGAAALAYSPDGKRLAVGSWWAAAVSLWDPSTGQLVGSLTGHPDGITALSWSARNRLLAAGGAGGVIRLWDPPTGRSRGALVALSGQRYLAVGPEGHFRGSGQVERDIVYVVQTDAGRETLSPAEFAAKYGWRNDPDRVRFAAD